MMVMVLLLIVVAQGMFPKFLSLKLEWLEIQEIFEAGMNIKIRTGKL